MKLPPEKFEICGTQTPFRKLKGHQHIKYATILSDHKGVLTSICPTLHTKFYPENLKKETGAENET